MKADPYTTDIVALVRPEYLYEPIEESLETLRRLEDQGAIGTVTVRSCPAAIPLDSAGGVRHSLTVYDEFHSWANRSGMSLAPGFEIVTISPIGSEEVQRVVRPPVFSFGVYRDDVLVAVFPHSTERRHYSARDGITLIRSGRITDFTPFSDGTRGRLAIDQSPWSCPECGGFTNNVQGIERCSECGWTAAGTDTGLPAIDEDKRLEIA